MYADDMFVDGFANYDIEDDALRDYVQITPLVNVAGEEVGSAVGVLNT